MCLHLIRTLESQSQLNDEVVDDDINVGSSQIESNVKIISDSIE